MGRSVLDCGVDREEGSAGVPRRGRVRSLRVRHRGRAVGAPFDRCARRSAKRRRTSRSRGWQREAVLDDAPSDAERLRSFPSEPSCRPASPSRARRRRPDGSWLAPEIEAEISEVPLISRRGRAPWFLERILLQNISSDSPTQRQVFPCAHSFIADRDTAKICLLRLRVR